MGVWNLLSASIEDSWGSEKPHNGGSTPQQTELVPGVALNAQ